MKPQEAGGSLESQEWGLYLVAQRELEKESKREIWGLGGANTGEKAMLKINDESKFLFQAWPLDFSSPVANSVWFYGRNSQIWVGAHGWSIWTADSAILLASSLGIAWASFRFPLWTSGWEFRHCLKPSQSRLWNQNWYERRGRWFCRASVLTWKVLNSLCVGLIQDP